MRLMIDTNAYAAFMRGDQDVYELLARADEILIPTPVLGELRAGFRIGSKEVQNLDELHRFLASPRVSIHPLGEASAVFYAEVHSALRTAGKPIPTNDLWIAAAALECGAALLTRTPTSTPCPVCFELKPVVRRAVRRAALRARRHPG